MTGRGSRSPTRKDNSIMEFLDTNLDDFDDLPSVAGPSAGPDALALLVKPEEAASLLQVSRSKIYELIRIGALKSLKIGGSRRITREALQEFVCGLQEAS